MQQHILEDDDGNPLGVLDMEMVTDAGCTMAFRMAAHCGDPVALDAIAADTLTAVGVDSFGYVAASALRYLAEQVLDPALTAGEAAGVHLRPGLLAISIGENPGNAFAAADSSGSREPELSRSDIARAVLTADAAIAEMGELFEPITSWTVRGVYDRRTDLDSDVTVHAGWNPASGETVRLGDHELTKREAVDLASNLLKAVKFLDGHFVYDGDGAA